MTALFSPGEGGLASVGRFWCETNPCDPAAFSIFSRHYSYRKRRRQRGNDYRFVGPGVPMVLIAPHGDALIVWRKERYRRDRQTGVNCTVFRNEGPCLSSEMIREACGLAWDRWPGERLFTFVDAAKVSSPNPGFCFLMAGWRKCGRTKENGLRILEVMPASTPSSTTGDA